MDSCLGVLEAAGGMLLLRNRLGSRRDEMAVGRGFGIALFAVARQTGFSVRVWSGGVAGFPAKRYAIGASALASVGVRIVKVKFSVAS